MDPSRSRHNLNSLAHFIVEENRFRVKQVVGTDGRAWIAVEVGLRRLENVKGIRISDNAAEDDVQWESKQ